MSLDQGESAGSARESIRGQLKQARARIVELETALNSAALKQTKEKSNG